MPEPRTVAARERLTRPASFIFEPGAESVRRRRSRAGRPGTVPVEIRNGMPEFRPYVYRGLGYDQLTGGDDD